MFNNRKPIISLTLLVLMKTVERLNLHCVATLCNVSCSCQQFHPDAPKINIGPFTVGQVHYTNLGQK